MNKLRITPILAGMIGGIIVLLAGAINLANAEIITYCWQDEPANSDGVQILKCEKVKRSSSNGGSNDVSSQITTLIEDIVIEEESTKLVGFGKKDMRGLYELTRLERTDVWADEYGNTYKYHGNNSLTDLTLVEKPFISDRTTAHGIDRNNNMFGVYIEGQNKLAHETICQIYNRLCNPIPFEEIDDIFTYEYPENYSSKRLDPEIVKKMLYEELKARKYL